MKTTLSIVGLLVVIAVCLGIVAKNVFIEEDDGYRSSRERALIKKFDKDGDGELNREERKAIEEAEAKRRLEYIKKFDRDGDGELSREEKEAAQGSMKGRKLEGAKKLKASNGDWGEKKERSERSSLKR